MIFVKVGQKEEHQVIQDKLAMSGIRYGKK